MPFYCCGIANLQHLFPNLFFINSERDEKISLRIFLCEEMPYKLTKCFGHFFQAFHYQKSCAKSSQPQVKLIELTCS